MVAWKLPKPQHDRVGSWKRCRPSLFFCCAILSLFFYVNLQSANAQSAEKSEPSADEAQAPIVGILNVATDGVSRAAATKFEASLEEGLKLHGLAVATRSQMRKMLRGSDYLDGCLFGPCLQQIYRTTEGRVTLVLVARIVREGSSYRFLVSLLDTKTGTPTAQMPTGCTVCTVEEAIAAATLAVVELVAGTDNVAILSPDGPIGAGGAADDSESSWSTSKQARILGYTMLGVGVTAAVASGLLFSMDRPRAGSGFLGASIGLGIGGASMLVVSGVF